MKQKFEYQFVRLGEGMFGLKKDARDHYQDEIHKYAAQGWRLVQIFAPSLGAYGSPIYYDLILEREVESQ